jgi:hypothetical protein
MLFIYLSFLCVLYFELFDNVFVLITKAQSNSFIHIFILIFFFLCMCKK